MDESGSMHSLRRILGITWSDRVPNAQVFKHAGLLTMYTFLRQRRLRWHGHVRRMEDGRMPKDILYSELASGKWSVGCPQLRYKVVCKRDLKALDIQTQSYEDMAADGSSWRSLRFRDSSKQGRSRSIPWPRKREPDERHAQVKQTQRPSTPVSDVEKSAFQKSDCLVTPKLCQPWKYHDIQLREHHQWSRPTDGGRI